MDYSILISNLHGCAARAKESNLTLGEVLDSMEEAAYSFICILLTLPFLQPISLGPLSTINGLTFAVLGWQLYRGHPSPVVPDKIRRVAIGQKTWEALINICLKLLGWCRRFSKPRHTSWVNGRKGQQVGGLILIAAGLLMAIPFFGIPFNNTLPALAIFFICVGELEQDGFMVFIALGWLVVTVIYFAIIFLVMWLLGEQAIAFLR